MSASEKMSPWGSQKKNDPGTWTVVENIELAQELAEGKNLALDIHRKELKTAHERAITVAKQELIAAKDVVTELGERLGYAQHGQKTYEAKLQRLIEEYTRKYGPLDEGDDTEPIPHVYIPMDDWVL
ncbi:hypothetical protein FWC31_01925 [Candidatus Saccharibacteria bacterium]|nr:hypothetical protein [Candidatus Saccharibacteria bacterium]